MSIFLHHRFEMYYFVPYSVYIWMFYHSIINVHLYTGSDFRPYDFVMLFSLSHGFPFTLSNNIHCWLVC